MKNYPSDYKSTLKLLKQGILESRYEAVKSVNKNLLQLYMFVGSVLSKRVEEANWGDKILEKLSNDLQTELPGLRGFSTQNIKKMRVFVDAWKNIFSDSPIGSPVVNQLLDNFWKIGFTHHYIIVSKIKNIEERIFYIDQVVTNAWSKRILEYNIKAKLFHQNKQAVHNFNKTLSENDVQLATTQFKDEYLLDYINIEESEDERILENKIVLNIKNFMMSLGTGFTFIGNQYRILIDGEEFFIDLQQTNSSLGSV